MIKNYLLILITLIFSTASYEQVLTFAPKGAVWTFEVIYFASEKIDFRRWISTGDTLIGGHICKVIQRKGSLVFSDISDKIIAYEDNNIVYWYNTTINKFTVLYDFNKSKGDSWIMQTDTCDLLINVDSTGVEIINGFSLKTLYISSLNNAFEGKVYQHIGSIYQPNPDINFTCYSNWIDYNFYHGLRCYEDTIFGFYDFKIAQNCNFVISSTDLSTVKMKINIFPIPFCDQTIFYTDEYLQNGSLIVTNLYGKIVKQVNNISGNTFTFLRGTLLSGLYYAQLIQFNKTIATGKLLISD
ncbi:MAG: T9SS type A sorting domain-containing protein [Saprospiraceae bacterium]|nr:T9SS type A sorting domain-containing protein [Saprospiraceae bacterium]MBK9728301.1 T9SS type A sorting domain-containing protein [Saprospiraceae bacterium]